MKYVLVRHRSPLVRKLGNTDVRLNLGKISNIKQAIKHVDGLVIPPGKIFSLWHQIGNPSQDRGYVNGMIISNGKVSEGIGGGLCQLSNFLFWMFLHCDVQILERRHHSLDIFPDSGRTLPFGSGASIFYNHIDLKVKNVSTNTLQLRIWLTDKYLCGQIRSDRLTQTKFKIREKNHYFIRKDGRFYRFNEIWREALNKGEKIREERMFVNFAPVLYQIGESDIKRNDYKLAEL